MIHFAMNITNQGTPVKTLSLQDLKLDPAVVAQDLMRLLVTEYSDIMDATQKVRPVN